jgi:uncharacterized protein YjbI with pentapeptide repeats
MDESESKKENQNSQRRFSQEQYDMLKHCSDNEDMTKWNKWRKDHADEVIWLQGRDFKGWWLKKANFMHGTFFDSQTKREINYSGEVHLENSIFEKAHVEEAEFFRAHLEGTRFQHAKARGASFNSAHLENARLSVAHLEDCNFAHAFLENANLVSSFLIGAKFNEAKIKGCWVLCSVVDGASKFWECKKINRYSRHERFTDFSGTALDNVIIDPASKQLLEYNIRRKNWEEWYPNHRFLQWPVWLFWLISDYGLRTWRIIVTFFGLAVVFAVIYWLWPTCVMVNQVVADIRGFWHALYFSVVTMTTLGFGDIAANPDNWIGQTLLMVQVILGYVLLGALVTRFAVLFTAGGPAGKFAEDRGQKTDDRELKTDDGKE